jgi:endonuclease YncB( thermonuclease family)
MVDTINEFSIVDEDDTTYYVIVNENSKVGSMNQQLIAEGLASVERDLPSKYKNWSEVELEAKTNQLRIWE